MHSGSIVSCSYSHLQAFITRLFHCFNGKWINYFNLWLPKLRYFSIIVNYQKENFSSVNWNSKASPNVSAATRHLESFPQQLSMNCFINFTACLIISFLFHQINLKAACFLICQLSRHLSILTLYKLPWYLYSSFYPRWSSVSRGFPITETCWLLPQ